MTELERTVASSANPPPRDAAPSGAAPSMTITDLLSALEASGRSSDASLVARVATSLTPSPGSTPPPAAATTPPCSPGAACSSESRPSVFPREPNPVTNPTPRPGAPLTFTATLLGPCPRGTTEPVEPPEPPTPRPRETAEPAEHPEENAKLPTDREYQPRSGPMPPLAQRRRMGAVMRNLLKTPATSKRPPRLAPEKPVDYSRSAVDRMADDL